MVSFGDIEEENQMNNQHDDGDHAFALMDLPEDLILEVVYRMPVRNAAQIKVLNNRFNAKIVVPWVLQEVLKRSGRKISILHYSASGNIKILSHLIPYSRNNSDISLRGVDEMNENWGFFSPISSSSGRLLLRFGEYSKSCFIVFNPILGAYRIIQPPKLGILRSILAVGLVDVDHGFSSSSSTIKIVAAVTNRSGIGLQFFIFESGQNSWRIARSRHSINPPEWNEIPKFDKCFDPVYIDNCMHWLLENRDILVFDFISRQAWILPKPDVPEQLPYPPTGAKQLRAATWFGKVDNCLSYVIPKEEDIFVYVFDHAEKTWNKELTIPKKFDLFCKRGRPIFWDGKTLLFVAGYCLKDVCSYDVLAKNWKIVGQLEGWADCLRCFHQFVPNFIATIPDCKYLCDNDDETDETLISDEDSDNQIRLRNIRNFEAKFEDPNHPILIRLRNVVRVGGEIGSRNIVEALTKMNSLLVTELLM